MMIFHSYVSLPEGKPPFSYGFPMVFMAALSRHPVLRGRHHRHGKAHQSEPRRKLKAVLLEFVVSKPRKSKHLS